MINEINFLKYVKEKLLSIFVLTLFIVVGPKLFAQYLRLSDLTLMKIIVSGWSVISILIVINLLGNLTTKVHLCKLIKIQPSVLKVNYYMSITLQYLMLICIFSLVWVTFIQIISFLGFNPNFAIITTITNFCNFMINSLSWYCELLYLVVYIFDIFIITFRHKIFL